MYTVNHERLQQTLMELAAFGYHEADKGVYRQGFSQEDMVARRWLMELAQKEGFNTYMDGAGNVVIRLGDADKPSVSMGSHLDSVPAGGIFDGTLGVIAGLEVLRVAKENNLALEFPLEVIGTSEEEGRFGGMFGAQALAGHVTPDWLFRAHDADGVMLKDAMEAHGMDPMDALKARRAPESMRAFLELHIEQGPVLEMHKKTIGVVEGISGVFKWIVHLIGKAGHAGTSPMHMRSDALMGLADFAHEIPRIVDEDGTDSSRITVGKVELKPGYPHTIPGEAMFTIVGRDMSAEVMKELADACNKALSAIARRHHLKFEYEQTSWLDPKPCNEAMTALVEKQAQKLKLDYMRMPSGAGHDAQFLTEITPTGLIFVPSVNGVSHAPDEWTHWQDVEAGANLLLNSALGLATGELDPTG